MDENTVPAERAEILMLRARVAALEAAVRALLAVPTSKEVNASLTENFDRQIAGYTTEGGSGDADNTIGEWIDAEHAYIREQILDRLKRLNDERPNGSSDDRAEAMDI